MSAGIFTDRIHQRRAWRKDPPCGGEFGDSGRDCQPERGEDLARRDKLGRVRIPQPQDVRFTVAQAGGDKLNLALGLIEVGEVLNPPLAARFFEDR